MLKTLYCDLAVIGSGPAGEGAALDAVKAGLKVIMIERDFIGGNSTHKGTIPSKALRHGVRKLIQAKSSNLYEISEGSEIFSFQNVLRVANAVIQRQSSRKSTIFNKSGISCIRGEASFKSNTSLVVKSGSDEVIVSFKNSLIATGSRPYRPDFLDFSGSRVFDSDTILSLESSPKRIIICGAGVIGCEYASIFSGLGLEVDLIDSRDRLLSFLDTEISSALSYHLSCNNVVIRHNEDVVSVDADEHSVVAHLRSGRTVKGDILLWCNGRTGNVDDLNLSTVGITPNRRGQIEVDASYQTSCKGIYAAGDVIGWPSLASASYDQGRAAVERMLDSKRTWSVNDFPTGIYTIPEISSVGKTEAELIEMEIPYEIGRAYFQDMARAQINGEEVGMLKILFHIETLEILGVHCFGYQASEIIHIGQAILRQPGEGNSIRYCVETTFNYPTMAEAYREAALDGLSKLK